MISSKLNSLRISSSKYSFSTANLSFSASISLNASAFFTAIATCAPNLSEQFRFLLGKRIDSPACQIQRPERLSLTDQRHAAHRRKPFVAQLLHQFGRKLIQFPAAKYAGFPVKNASARGRIFQRDTQIFFSERRVRPGKIERFDLEQIRRWIQQRHTRVS